MWHVNLDNIPTFAPKQSLLPEAGLLSICPAPSQSFNDLLQQVQARPAGAAAENAESQSRPQPAPDANVPSSSARNAAEEHSAKESASGAAREDEESEVSGRAPASDAPTTAGKSEAAQCGGGKAAESAQPGSEARSEKRSRDEAAGTHKSEAAAAANPEPHSGSAAAKAEAGGGNGGAAKSDEAAGGEAAAGFALDSTNALESRIESAAAKPDAKAAAAQEQTLRAQPDITADPALVTAKGGGKGAAPARSARGADRAASIDENTTEQPVAKPGSNANETVLSRLGRRRQGATEVSQANGPRHAEHGEQRCEGAAGHTGQALAARPAGEAEAGAPTAVKPDTVKLPSEQIASAPAEKVETSPVTAKPSSAVAAENQADLSAREGKSQSPRAGTPTTTQKANESAQVDRVRFVQRVARAFQAVGDRGGTVRLRLSPPELGSLRVEVAVRQGTMTAQLHVEKASTRNLLLDNLSALRDRLAQQNIKIEQFQVDLLDYSSGGSSDRAADQAQSQDFGGGYRPPQATRERTAEPAPADAHASARRPGEGTQLDVII